MLHLNALILFDLTINNLALTAAPTNECPRRRPRGPWISAFTGSSMVLVVKAAVNANNLIHELDSQLF